MAEAARVLDVPVGTVKSRCARGRARLLPLLTHLRADNGSGGGGNKSGGGRNRTQGHPSHRQRDRTMRVHAMQDQAIQLL